MLRAGILALVGMRHYPRHTRIYLVRGTGGRIHFKWLRSPALGAGRTIVSLYCNSWDRFGDRWQSKNLGDVNL